MISSLLLLLGIKKESIGLTTSSSTAAINFNTRNSFGVYSFKAALVFLFLFGSLGANAQVTTNSSSGLAATYGSLSAAITALNAATITAPVTITLTASNPQTAPAGGYSITATGTATNTITITGNSNTITAPAQTAGNLNDAIFKIIGGDYITIQGFNMQERSFTPVAADTTAGTNTMTEFGVALFYTTATNGAQNDIIQNNTISLNRTYQNTFGIYANATHTATAVTTSASATGTAGGNTGLKVYGNTISNVNNGILVLGPTAVADANTGIDIGGSSSGTGNTITNYGTTGTFSSYPNLSGTVNGILVRNSNGFNVSYNSITSSDGGVTIGTLNGIQIQAATNIPTATFTNTITNNTLSLQTGLATGGINGINYPAASASTTSVVNISNNNFTRINCSVTASGAYDAILCQSTNLTTTISNNTFTNLTANTSGNFRFIVHNFTMPANGSTTINGNSIVTAFNKTGAGGTVTLTTTSGSSPSSASLTQTGNNFSNITVTGATAITGFQNGDGASTSCSKTITGNTFNNWIGGTSAILGMNFTYWGGGTTNSYSNNTITNITGQGAITAMTVGSAFGGTNTVTMSGNVINNLSSTGTGGQVLAISCANTSTIVNINNNAINTLSSTAASSAVGGILVSGATTTNVFLNTIYGLATSGATAPISLGIQVAGGTTVNVYQNKIYNLSASGSALTSANSAVSGIYLSGGTTVNTYNNLIGGLTTPAANLADAIRGINIISTTATSTQRVYGNTVYMNATSTGTNFGSTGIFHTHSLTASTSVLDLRNNIIVNASSANGTGLAVAFRRSVSTDLLNYASTSNNNLFFGTSGVYNNNSTTYAFGPFQTLVSTRETASRNQNLTFASTTGSDATFLNFANGAINLAGGNGQVISGYTTDYSGATRDGVAPDMGAYEFAQGTIPAPTVSSFSPAAICVTGGQTITITGTNLDTVTTVLFNGSGGITLPGTITGQTATSITVTAPPNVVDGAIRVTSPGGSTDSASTFTAAPTPTIGVSSAVTICSGVSTTLTATGGATYAWSPSTGLSATTGNTVTASPTTTTTYTVTGTSAAGCSATNTVIVTVNPSPVAGIATASVASVCIGSSFNLTSTGTGAPASVPTTNLSPTGDGGFETGATFPLNNFTVVNGASNQWSVGNAAGVQGGTNAAFIGALNVATGVSSVNHFYRDFAIPAGSTNLNISFYLKMAVIDSGYDYLNVYYTTTNNTPVAGTLPSTGYTQILAYTTPAIANYTLFSGTLPNSLAGTTIRLVFTYKCDSVSPFGAPAVDNISLSSTPLDIPTYAWTSNPAGFTSNVKNPTAVSATQSATYTVTLTGSNGCTATANTSTVTVNALPTIAAGSATICAGGSGATLTAAGGATYVWSPSTGLSATTGTSVTATPATSTTYTVTGTDANGCLNTTTSVVTVNNPVVITGQPSNVIALVGSTNVFTVAATATGITYQWQVDSGSGFGDITGETAASLSVTATDTASYRCVVSGTSPCTPVTSNVATLTISSVSFLTQPQPQTICSNASATFAVTTDGAVTSYQWQYSTDSGANWFDLSGETASTLVLGGQTAASNGYLIRCSLNAGEAISNSALLTVYDAVAIGTQPSNQSICSGAASSAFIVAASGSNLSYQWEVSTNGTNWSPISGATSATYTITNPANALNGNQYHAIVSGSAPCSSLTSAPATLTITNVTVAASSASICIGGSTTVSATFTGAPDYTTSSWTSTTGSGADTAVSGTSATVTPTAAGTYVYTFASNGTCPFTKTVTVTVNALPIISSVTATPGTVCSDANISLTAASVTVATGSATIGAGATTSATYSNPFYSAWSNNHTQHLITVAELTAMGLSAGNITSVGLNVTSAGSLPMINLSVKIGTTSATAMTAFVSNTGFQTVYTSASLLPTTGVNTLTFTAPFYWNGTSNLVLEFCHGNSASTSTMSRTVQADATSYVSTIKAQISAATSAATICGDTTSQLVTYSVRPKFIFAGQVATNLASTYNWSWNTTPAVITATGTTAVTNISGATVSQTFTATATTAAGCTNSLTTAAVQINSTIPAPTATNSTQCGTSTPTCSVAGSGRSGATFKWYLVATAGTALAGQTGSTLTSYPVAADTTFYVSEVSADGLCESPRAAVSVTVTAPFAFSLSSATATNCSGSASLTPVTIATNGGYTSYSWSNAATVSGNETTGWSFSPTTTTTYTVTATGGGCSTTASVVVTPTALPVVNVTAVPSSICVGASSTVTATTNVIGAGNIALGAGASTSSSSGASMFPGSYGGAKTQFIIKASELSAVGLLAGNITSLNFEATTAFNGYEGFALNIGHTTATAAAMPMITSGLTQVYSGTGTNGAYATTVGVNTLGFSSPFNWDGTSNIVLSFCWAKNPTATSTTGTTVKTDSPGFTCSVYGQKDSTIASTMCPLSTTSDFGFAYGTGTSRPKFTFAGQTTVQGAGALTYTWNDPATTTGNVLTVSPTATTAYSVYGYNGTTGCTGTATATVTMYAPPTAPSVTSATQCGTRVPLVSVADTNGYTTPVFKWYTDNTTTTALQTSTSTTYTTSVSATTTFYVSVVSPGGCESPRTAVTTTVVAPATLSVSPAATVCAGGSATLTASGAVSYTWTPALGLNGTTSPSVIATPTATTTYSVTGVDANGCTTAAATVVVTVIVYPTAVTASASTASVCNGGTVNLTAAATGPANTLVNFSQGFETFPPTGWTMLNPGFGSPWQATNPLEPSGVRSGASSMAYYFDEFDAGNAWAISPSQALTAGVPYTVSFWYRVPATLFTEKLKLTVGTSNTVAAQTTTLLTYTSLINIQNFTQATVTFTPTVTGVYFFGLNAFSNADQDTLYVDDFTITGGQAAPVLTYAWTSSPSGYTSTSQNPTNVVVNATTTYTVTASNGSCGTSASTTAVTAVPLPNFSLNGATTICKGQSTTLTATGSGYTYVWTPALGLNGTTSATVSANPTATTTYTVEATDTATGCKATQQVVVTVSDPGAINPIGTTTSQIAVPGGTTTFTVATAPGATYTYQWQVNTGSSFTNLTNDSTYAGVDSATLTISDIQSTFDTYQYQCLVTGASPCATLTPIVATLTVSDTGIAQQPQSVTVCAPAATLFTIVTNGDDPYGIQWQMSTDNGASYADLAEGTETVTGLTFSGVDQATLNVSGITLANSGLKFLCVLNYYLPSDAATLTVKAPVVITTQPTDQTVCAAGGTAIFTAAATGSDVTYQWQVSTNGTTWANYTGTGAASASISIVNPAVAANGTQYKVLVSGNAACTAATSTVATLYINNPTITAAPVDAIVLRGDTAIFTVAASAATSYQWQYSATLNGTYNNVVDATPGAITYSGADTATLSVITTESSAISAANFYRCVVTNNGCIVTSVGAKLTVNGYCTPVGTSALSYFDAFETTGGTNNISNVASGYSATGYGNFASQSASQILGNTISYTTTLAGTTVGVAIWVDWNRNGTFETTERMANTTGYVSTFSGSFAVPMTATVGTTRMRILMDYNATNPANPCAFASGRGEVEDYTFVVAPQPVCATGAFVAGTASVPSAALCYGTGTTLSLTGVTTGVTGLTYQWYVSANGVDFTPVSGATATTLATGNLTANASYYCVTSCSAGGSETSNTVAITVANPLITGSTPAGRCGKGTVTLDATANAGSTINWYAAATGGSPLASGTSFTTPSIATTTTYYAEAITGGGSVTIGAASPSVGTYGTSFTGSYEIFTVATPVSITSVNAYATAAGTVTVELLSSTGALLQTSPTYTITAGQANTTLSVVGTPISIPVGFDITPGTDYRLNFKAGSTATLVRNSAGAATTYGPVLGLTITGNSNASAGYYYNFYNWSISSGCSSARTAVVATVTPTPTAAISYTSPLCSTAGSASVTLSGANAYTGGTFSSTAGLTLDAVTGAIDVATSSPGTYTVTYTTNAVANCVAQTATTTVTINQALTSGFAYDTAAYCTNQGTVTPTITGTAGTFTSSPAGLSINATTGVITLASSAAGTYTVTNTVVVAGCATSVTTVTVTVNTAVVISSQPVNVSQLPGDNTSFSVTATGTGLTYQWEVNDGIGWATISGATASTLNLTAVTAEMNTYQYRAIVSGAAACASVTSNAATLTVNSAAIATHPVNFTACNEGATTATFAVTTTGTVTSYQWQLSTNGTIWTDITNGGIYANADTATLSLSGVSLANDTNQFRCVLNGAVNSNPATLTIKTAVAITTQPFSTSGCSAGSASFTVAASGSGLSYQWQVSTNGTTWTNITAATSATLTLNSLTAGMTGYQYQAIVSGASPCSPLTSSAATLTVNTVVAISAQPASSTVCNAANATFTVTATGTAPTYQWEMSTNGTSWSPISAGTAATLTLTGVTTAMTGYSYRVVVSGAAPCVSVTSSAAVLTVSQPVAPTIAASSTDFCPGSVVTLTAGNLGTVNTYDNSFDVLPSNFATSTVGTGTPTAVLSTTYKSEGTGSVWFNTTSTSASVAYSMNADVNLAGTSNAQLSFSHQALMEGSTYLYDRGLVDYSIDGGTTWNTFDSSSYAGGANISNFTTAGLVRFTTLSYPDWVVNYTSSSSLPNNAFWKNETFNIPVSALTSQFRIRFRYITDGSTNYYGWLIDNVKISVAAATTWSPTTNLFTNAAATTAYTGGNAGVVYAKPVASASYTVATANSLGCTNTSSVNLNMLAPSTLGSIAQPLITCSGAQTLFNVTGMLPNSTSTLSYTVNGGATQTVTGVVADASGNATFTRAFSGINNGQTLAITAILRTDLTPNCTTAISANNTVVIAVQPTVTYFADADGDGFGNNAVPQVTCQGKPVGYVTNNTDCNDADATMNATFTFYADTDGDGYGAGSAVLLCAVDATTPPAGFVTNNTDCAPSDATTWRSTTLYVDADADGYDYGTATVCWGATVPTGYAATTLGSDCNDADATMNATFTFYADTDGDGYGAGNAVSLCAVNATTPPTGYVTNNTDCAPTDNTKWQFATFYVDADADGYTAGTAAVCSGVGAPSGYSATSAGTDCDDNNNLIYQSNTLYTDVDGDTYTVGTGTVTCYGATLPAGTTLTQNGSDCNDADATMNATFTFYADTDGDGYGAGNDVSLCAVNATTPPTGYVTNNTDCAPSDATTWRSTTLYVDADADGYDNGTATVCWGATVPTGYATTTLGSDCNDADATKNASFNFYVDADGDGYGAGSLVSVCAVNGTTPPAGYVMNNTDCNDNNAAINQSFTFYVDADGDGYGSKITASVCAASGSVAPAGYSLNGTDCNDSNASIYQSASLYIDADADGYNAGQQTVCYGVTIPTGYSLTTSGSDCNDADATKHASYLFYVDTDGDGYGAGAAVTVCAVNADTPPVGYSTNDTDCNASVYSATNTCSSVVTIKMNIEGYYDVSTGAMRPVMANQGVGSSTTDVDTVTIELHDATTYALVVSTTAMLQTDGTAVATFSTAPAGSFYLVVRHRNALETWSATPQTVGATAIVYDFTTSADKAYGGNMKMLASGVYGFYSGDINQDGFIEGLDYAPLFNDSDSLLEGYQTTDLNGDGFVEGLDYPILFNNSDNLIEAIRP